MILPTIYFGFFVLQRVLGTCLIAFTMAKNMPVVNMRSRLLVFLYQFTIAEPVFQYLKMIEPDETKYNEAFCVYDFSIWKTVLPKYMTVVILMELFLYFRNSVHMVESDDSDFSSSLADENDNDVNKYKKKLAGLDQNQPLLSKIWPFSHFYTDKSKRYSDKHIFKIFFIFYIYQLIFPAIVLGVKFANNYDDSWLCSSGFSSAIIAVHGLTLLVPIFVLVKLVWNIQDSYLIKVELKTIGIAALLVGLPVYIAFLMGIKSTWVRAMFILFYLVSDFAVLWMPAITAIRRIQRIVSLMQTEEESVFSDPFSFVIKSSRQYNHCKKILSGRYENDAVIAFRYMFTLFNKFHNLEILSDPDMVTFGVYYLWQQHFAKDAFSSIYSAMDDFQKFDQLDHQIRNCVEYDSQDYRVKEHLQVPKELEEYLRAKTKTALLEYYFKPKEHLKCYDDTSVWGFLKKRLSLA